MTNKDSIQIIVNLKPVDLNKDDLTPDGEISFDKVVALASEAGNWPTGPFIEYEVFYEDAIARPSDGQLFQGEDVKVQQGTIFNVTYTDRS